MGGTKREWVDGNLIRGCIEFVSAVCYFCSYLLLIFSMFLVVYSI